LAVSIDGIVQRAPINYTTTANTITFTSAPPTGANVHIKHLGFRSSSVVTAIPAGTTITQPILSNPTITLAAEGSSFKGNVALFDAAGTSQVGRFGATSTGQVQLDVGANTVSVRASTIALANVTSFSTANTTGFQGLGVDAAARVIKPYQPCYVGLARSGNLNTSGESNYTTFVHSTTRINTGGHMNTSTGQFTCPVAGKYLVSFQALVRGSGSFNAAIVKNGAQWNQLGRAIVAGSTEQNLKTFAVVECAVNDVLRIDCSNSGGDFYTEHNSSTIYFVG
jgi:hypothetical protein